MQYQKPLHVPYNGYLKWIFVDRTGIYLYYMVLRTNNNSEL